MQSESTQFRFAEYLTAIFSHIDTHGGITRWLEEAFSYIDTHSGITGCLRGAFSYINTQVEKMGVWR